MFSHKIVKNLLFAQGIVTDSPFHFRFSDLNYVVDTIFYR